MKKLLPIFSMALLMASTMPTQAQTILEEDFETGTTKSAKTPLTRGEGWTTIDSYKGEKWTVAAYILYDGEYYYSDPKEFETKKEVQIKITLKTPSQANGDIFTNGCKLNGEIEDYYNLNRQGSFGKYGVCYAVDKTPTIDDYTATVTS